MIEVKESDAKKVLKDIKHETNDGRQKLNKEGYKNHAADRIFPWKPKGYVLELIEAALCSPYCKDHLQVTKSEIRYLRK